MTKARLYKGSSFVHALLGGLAIFSSAPAALAFKEAGHRSIEAAAYRQLLENDADYEVIRTLIEHGVLNPPSAPLPPATELLDPDFATLTVDSLVVESHFPDHLFDRQLQANRQCFHFNARGGHYKLTDARLGDSLIPLGLSEDAYLECVGVADTLLRGLLFDPRGSQKAGSGMYTLMHMIEDSFADSHVARITPDDDKAKEPGDAWQIVYIKPWNLRTWPRYFFGNKHGEAVRSHFSAEHHMGSDTRDLGYLVGPTDENYEKNKADPKYQQRIKDCVAQAGKLMRRHRDQEYEDEPITIETMQGEIVVPPVCLSQRAERATDAVRDLLKMVATLVPHVGYVRSKAGELLLNTGVKQVVGPTPETSLEEAWRNYRYKHLAYFDPYLTHWMSARPARHVGKPKPLPAPREPRKDLVHSSEALTPRQFHESGLGLSAELRSGTPLWLGIEEFLSRKTSNHNRPVLLLDSFGWGAQVRLPIEDEKGERPAGVAFDFGSGLPLPISELVSLQELQIFVGVRGRVAYTAQSVFEAQTRHAIEIGFGGVSVDLLVGNTAWFGFDAPRKMYRIDFWSNSTAWQSMLWSFSAGMTVDAF